jgi:hypothetical protein
MHIVLSFHVLRSRTAAFSNPQKEAAIEKVQVKYQRMLLNLVLGEDG